MTNYTIVQKLTLKAIEKPSKKIEAVSKFLVEEFNTVGLNLPYAKVCEKFATWNDKEKTVIASSLDLHKVLFTASFITASRIVKEAGKNSYDLKKVVIPYFFTNKEGVTLLQTRKASEFEELYYTTLDGLKEEEEKASKVNSSDDSDKEEGDKEEFNATAKILDLMTKYKDSIDFVAIQHAIEGFTATATDKATATA